MARPHLAHPALVGLLAFLAAGSAQAREFVCGKAERTFDGGKLEVIAIRRDDAPVTPLWVHLTLGDKDAPLGLAGFFKGAANGLGLGDRLVAIMRKPDLHAPTRSTVEFVEAVAPDGSSWRSEPQTLPAPHAPEPGERVDPADVLLARIDAKSPLNPDLVRRLAWGESLTLTRRGDEGEMFATVKVRLPPRAAFDALYAGAWAEASSQSASCSPYFTISNVPPYDWRKQQRLYLGPEDGDLLTRKPTLAELAAVDPSLGKGKIRGRALVACVVGEQGRLADCQAGAKATRPVDVASRLAAQGVELAPRLADGRRTVGLGVVLALDWDKDTVRYAIISSGGAPVPPATSPQTPAP